MSRLPPKKMLAREATVASKRIQAMSLMLVTFQNGIVPAGAIKIARENYSPKSYSGMDSACFIMKESNSAS